MRNRHTQAFAKLSQTRLRSYSPEIPNSLFRCVTGSLLENGAKVKGSMV